ncbi:DUF5959 family protein [Nocardioides sp. NPDC000445]|uniref:DUF5959 family protein n=1 Tax=Nocardioides sp. NPDC000445 TaxID=3154257 RepID=UPI00332A2E0A
MFQVQVGAVKERKIKTLIEIRGEDELTLRVLLRDIDRDDAVEAREFEGELTWSGSLQGSWPLLVAREDIVEWQDVLDYLDAGENAKWAPSGRALNLAFARDIDRGGWYIDVLHPTFPYIKIRMHFDPDEEWFETSYRTLSEVLA